MIAPRTVRRTVFAGALVVGVTAGMTGAAVVMLVDAVVAGQGNGYGYIKSKGRYAPGCAVG